MQHTYAEDSTIAKDLLKERKISGKSLAKALGNGQGLEGFSLLQHCWQKLLPGRLLAADVGD